MLWLGRGWGRWGWPTGSWGKPAWIKAAELIRTYRTNDIDAKSLQKPGQKNTLIYFIITESFLVGSNELTKRHTISCKSLKVTQRYV